MENTLDIARIKQYNKELKEYTERSAQARAEYELSLKELNRLCEELTAELNITVTPDNIEQVYNRCVESINNTLTTGEEILNRIKMEEAEQRGGGKVIPHGTVQSHIQSENQTVQQIQVETRNQEVQKGNPVVQQSQIQSVQGIEMGTTGSGVGIGSIPTGQTLDKVQRAIGGTSSNPFISAASKAGLDMDKMIQNANTSFEGEFDEDIEPLEVD